MSLSHDQLDHLERRLEEERDRVRALLDRIVDDRAVETGQEAAGDLSVMPTHMADLGTDAINEEVDESNATRISRELEEIDAAIERLRASPERFGLCENSDREIPFSRLDIIPWARTCD